MADDFSSEQKSWLKDEVRYQLNEMKDWIKDEIVAQLDGEQGRRIKDSLKDWIREEIRIQLREQR